MRPLGPFQKPARTPPSNPVEQTIRPVAIGKKNWLFAGSERA
ncbi:MAG: hypothetical protein EBY15_12605, partial [Gammaproteobacteria bacterium]|nr:hypothetical protein [Gammaproteobacteria bacterium]